MQYANDISYKYSLTELCILLYPFGLHRLPAPAPEEPQHWTRERLDTPRQHRSGRSASRRSGDRRRETRRQHQRQSLPEIKPRSGTPEEPEPARRQQRRQDRQQTPSHTRAAEIEPEPESQKRGTVDHGRRRTETERRRAEKEMERRENDSKTPLFSPSHRTPSRSTARASPAPADMNGSRNAAFFGSAFVEYAELTEINGSFDHTEGGDGSHFHDFTNAKNLALYPLLHASIFFTKSSSHKHTVHQRYISLQI